MGFLIDRDQPVIWRAEWSDSPISLSGTVGRTRLSDCRYATRDWRCSADSNSSSADGGCRIVTTPQTVALLDFRKGLKMFQQMQIPVLGIVENMSYFIPPDMPDKQYDILGLAAVKRQLKN